MILLKLAVAMMLSLVLALGGLVAVLVMPSGWLLTINSVSVKDGHILMFDRTVAWALDGEWKTEVTSNSGQPVSCDDAQDVHFESRSTPLPLEISHRGIPCNLPTGSYQIRVTATPHLGPLPLRPQVEEASFIVR